METEDKKKSKKKWIWIGIIVFVVAAIGANVYAMKLKNPKTAEDLAFTTVEGQTMEDTLIAQGKVVPKDMTHIYRDPSKGAIDEIFVEEGDEVKKGDKLIRYEGTETDGQEDSLQVQKERLQLQIDHQKDQITDLEDQIADAKDKDLPDETIEELEKQKDEAEYQKKLSHLELRQVNEQMEDARKQDGNLVVKSEMAGVVQNVAKTPSANGNGSEPVITVIAKKPYEVRGTLTEYDVVDVKKGNTVTIRAKALGNEREWEGKVTEVGDTPVQQSPAVDTAGEGNESVTSYPFTVKLDDSKDLRHGYHVTAEIVIDKHENVPAVPFDAILTVQDQEVVFVVKDGELDRRPIKTGLVNDKFKEITEGVGIGDQVVLNPSDELHEGMKVVAPDDQTE